MQTNSVPGIPRPLVRTNQWFIVLSVVTAWAFHTPWILALPFLAGLLGMFAKFNPVMRFARLFLKKPMSEYVFEEPAQQQFNQVIALICLGASMAFWSLGMMTFAIVFSALVFLAAFVAILGFCVGCYIRFKWHQFRHRQPVTHRH